jgi:hypothetical protein
MEEGARGANQRDWKHERTVRHATFNAFLFEGLRLLFGGGATRIVGTARPNNLLINESDKA